MIATTDDTTARRPSSRTKGILAIAAGTALLIGGTGTFAYWSTQQALTADDIVSGDLDLALGDGEWSLDGAIGGATVIPAANIGAVRIVPGDVLTLQQDLDVTLVGDTIEAILTIDTTDVIPASQAAYFDVAFTSGAIGTPDGTNAFRLDEDDAGTVPATLTITFDAATAARDGVNTTLDLSALDFTLTQAAS